ncbi:hypothetical protein JCM9957A_24800 [Kineosporia succinea]
MSPQASADAVPGAGVTSDVTGKTYSAAQSEAAEKAAGSATTTESGGIVTYRGQALSDLTVVPPERTDGVLRLTVGLGDSITYRQGSWFRRVCGSGVIHTCRDSGIRGDTTEGMVKRLQTDVLDLHPEVVTVMAGTNDMLHDMTTAQSMRNIHRIVTRIQDSGSIVVLCTIAPRNATPKQAAALNKAIRAYARNHDVPLLDTYPLLAAWNGRFKAGLSNDGVHPNTRGMKLMADFAETNLPRLIASAK